MVVSKMVSKQWWKAAGIRALKTVAQAAIATIGTAAFLTEVNWVAVVSASVLAGILSLLTSLAGLPELEDKNENHNSDDGLDVWTEEIDKLSR